MLQIFLLYFTFTLVHTRDIPSLPYCPENYETGLILVSTLDGKISALNSNGSLVWDMNTGPGPLLLSNIHDLELTNNGEWIRIIPSLTGILYKFDGSTIDPIPISAEDLLKSSFMYSTDLVIAGGIEIRTYGVGFRTGTLFYECSSLRCSNNVNNDDDVLLVERSTRTIRAVEPRTGVEKWNFSVGLHNIKLPRISCINEHLKLDWNFSAVIPEGKLFAFMRHNDEENGWQYIFDAPIVKIWKWNGKDLSEVNVFSLQNVQKIVTTSFLPSIYLGMHKQQLYIHESQHIQNKVQELLYRKPNSNNIVTESTSIAKIPWKPIRASTDIIEDDATAVSVLNGSDYVNGHGFYLYTEEELKLTNTVICKSNNSFNNITYHKTVEKIVNIYTYLHSWWKELFLLVLTSIVCHVFLIFWNQRVSERNIFIIEKPADPQIIAPVLTEVKDSFTSRFEKDFETIRCLGKGGFGVVFEVKQKYDECKYAIKRITLPNEKDSRDRVMREVKALAKLDHQNIVRYFGSWVEEPPFGWQQNHDEKWIRESDYSYVDEISSFEQKVKRSKSVSFCIDIPLNDVESKISNSSLKKENDSDEDSYIVFEHSKAEKDNYECTPDKHLNQSSTNSGLNVSSSESAISSMTLSDHSKKKIDWRKPGRKHYSWDSSFRSSYKKQENPPIYLYIQMQLCRDESLKEWLVKNKKRDHKLVLNFFFQLLEAVDYVHQQGLIHRDLKPSNIFFSLDGQIKVGDFGLVKDVEDAFDLELIKKGSPSIYRGHTVEVGTQLYMSPEQFKTRIYDNKVDIYSLGLIFFELLFPFSTEMERIKILSDVKNNYFPTDFPNKFPDECILLENMLSEDPTKRLTITDIKVKAPFNRQDSGYSEESPNKSNQI